MVISDADIAVGCRYLAEVEMRLHLIAEDTEASLQEQSKDALYRIPAAVQEISHVKASHTAIMQHARQSGLNMTCSKPQSNLPRVDCVELGLTYRPNSKNAMFIYTYQADAVLLRASVSCL